MTEISEATRQAYGALAWRVVELLESGAYPRTSIGECAAVLAVAQERLTDAVLAARVGPVQSWAAIGAELGVTAQAAQQRYGKLAADEGLTPLADDDEGHGTPQGYHYRKCRCGRCRAAYLAREGARQSQAATTLADDDPRHGTMNGYTNFKCRCDRCRGAVRAYSKARRARARAASAGAGDERMTHAGKQESPNPVGLEL